jgi:dihydrofolate reductase/thymidylate synthase
MFEVIVACTITGGIGKDGNIPWKISSDLKNFYKLTIDKPENKNNILIIGRKTFESIGSKPLKNRINIIISKTLNEQKDIIIANDFISALNISNNMTNIYKIFVIGGSEIYKEAIKHPLCKTIHLTLIKHDIDCDTYFPIDLLSNYKKNIIDSDIQDNNYIYDRLIYKK